MKKLIFILALILTMASSIVAGSLAMYTVSVGNMAGGSTVAKEFIFTSAGTDSFQQGLKIAPAERNEWQFKVKNYQGNVVSETNMYYKLTFHVTAAPGKQAIAPLVVSVKNQNGEELNSVTGVGTFDVLGSFPLAASGQEADYIVELYWPGDGNSDINYAGSHYGTSINVDAVASQVPLSEDGGGNNPPQQSALDVLYETTYSWQNGQNGIDRYNYQVKITNNSTEPIDDWYIKFSLPTDRPSAAANDVWNAKFVSGLPAGSYQFDNPAYNNSQTDDILPGQTVTFGGAAFGKGREPIQDIQVGGSNVGSPITDVKLSTEFGKSQLKP